MLRMILADDEPVITGGIQMLVDWHRLGITISGVYENGRAALSAILADPPDVAILDVSMPGKTGLEILRAINEARCPTKVIFLSGFGEFTFAQTALQYGAKDYLLKPVNKDSLVAAVRKCVSLSATTGDEAPGGDSFLPTEAYRALAATGQDMFTLAAAYLSGHEQGSSIEKQFGLFSAIGKLQEQLSAQNAGHTFQKGGEIWLVLTGQAAQAPEPFLETLRLHLAASAQLAFVYSGNPAPLSTLKGEVPACHEALGYFYYEDALPKRVLQAGQPVFEKQYTESELKALRDGIVTALFEQNREAMGQGIEEYLFAACTISGSSSDTAIYYLLSCIRAVEERFDALGAPLEASLIVSTMDKARKTTRYSQMKVIFTSILQGYFDEVTTISQSGEKKDILKAKSLIEERYTDNLTLDVMAKHIHMNPFYFSSFFKKQTGENFKDYLNKIRLRHGMELLVMTDKKIYEIAEAVGFKDYRYFTELFTKAYGKTPMAYRKELAGSPGKSEGDL